MAVARIRDIRRRELLEAALEIIKREGLPATTLSRIADEAGVSKMPTHAGVMMYSAIAKRRRSTGAAVGGHLSFSTNNTSSTVSAAWIYFKAGTYSRLGLARPHRAIHQREWSNLAHVLASFQSRPEARNTALASRSRAIASDWPRYHRPISIRACP